MADPKNIKLKNPADGGYLYPVTLGSNVTVEGGNLGSVAPGAQVNVIETIKVDNVAQTVTSKAVNIDLSGKVDKVTGSSLVEDTKVASYDSHIANDDIHVTAEQKTTWSAKQDALTAGTNIQIADDGKTISATDTTYSAGNGLDLTGTTFSVDTTDTTTVDATPTADSTKLVQSGGVKAVTDALDERIDNLESRGRYLSTWDCSTGLPQTDPTTSPYAYRTGDYYIVGVVASSGSTNYRPDGSSYTKGVASTTVESESVAVNDTYIYDGSVWKLLKVVAKEVSWGSITGTLSNQSDLSTALAGKVDKETGKGLSTNDYTTAEQTKLAGIAEGAQVNVIETIKVDGTALTVTDKAVNVDLSGKVTKNADITAGTHTKITYDAKGLVTAGADLAEADIPDLHLAKVTDVTATAAEVNVLDGIEASTAELNYVKGVTSAIQTQLDGKEATLTGAKLSAVNSGITADKVSTYDGYAATIASKVTANEAITGATKCKITYDAKGLVTAGADLAASDIPSLELTKISDVTATAAEVNVLDGIAASTTELNYVAGVTSSIQDQLDAKQGTLTTAQLASVNSGITSTKVSTYDGYAATIAGKQDALTAGTNIQINDNVISATDTTYSVFTGAGASSAGTSGLVPAPASGANAKVLCGDGNWVLGVTYEIVE